MNWLRQGNTLMPRDTGADIGKLPPHVYTIGASRAGIFLEFQQEQFAFPYKLYNTDNFPDRVAHTYNCLNGNLGVLLTGLKGTGKTVQAEQICNKIKLPVLLVQSNLDHALVPFLNSIDEDIVVFIDEYEKVFERSNELLVLMDGALRTKYRRIFVLTTNETYISDSMMNRPSRILYCKQFGNLDGATIVEIVNDMIEDPTARREAIKFMGSLEIITVDIVKAICAEMVRFGELPGQFANIMNVRTRRRSRKNVHHLIGGQEILVGSNVHIEPVDPFQQFCIDDKDRFAVKTDDDPEWTWFGDITAFDRLAGTITTTQGTFRIAEAMVHPSLLNVLTMAM